ncbi:MAG: efflux RND transporter periplasmic adaptor subunit [Sulfurospirillaceae bacterium]|nr:efflux RND transporter periplasmic adaptor subunit [Sulfurospirillaceae bacterium]
MKRIISKNLIFLLLSISILLLSGCAKTQEQKEIKGSDNNISVRIEGAVYPIQKQDVISSAAGYVKKVYVKDGDKVKKGDIIYSLDKGLMKLDIENIKMQINSLEKIRDNAIAKGSIDGSIPAINLAAIELKKISYLRSKGYINDFEENEYKKNYINAMYSNKTNETNNFDKIKNLNSEIMSKKIDLKKLEYQLKYANAYAQIDGFVVGLKLSPRESVDASVKICSVVNIDKVIVKAGFATGLLPFVHKKQKVNISFVTTPSYSTTSEIKQINPIVDAAYGSMTVEMIVPNHNYILQEGTRALVTVSLSKQGQKEIKKYFLNNKNDTTLEIKSKI